MTLIIAMTAFSNGDGFLFYLYKKNTGNAVRRNTRPFVVATYSKDTPTVTLLQEPIMNALVDLMG